MSTAFALWGGGSLGAVQVGMLRALTAHGIRADLVVGASVGALNGTYYAARPDADGVEELVRAWLDVGRHDVYPFGAGEAAAALSAHLPWHPWRGLAAALGARNYIFPFHLSAVTAAVLGRRNYLFGNQAFTRFLRRIVPIETLEQARIPLSVLTTEVTTGNAVALSEGDAVPALLASAAIPGIYPSVKIAGRSLMDGGFADRTTLDIAVAQNVDDVYLLAPGFPCDLPAAPDTAMAMALHAYNLFNEQREVAAADRVATRARVHVVPTVCPIDVLTIDFGHTAWLIEQAGEITKRWLDDGEPAVPARALRVGRRAGFESRRA